MTQPAQSSVLDVAIVGGGFAGTLAAAALARAGCSVALIEASAAPAPVFRAEKINGEQLRLLPELRLMDFVAPASSRAHEFVNIHGAHTVDRAPVEEYGFLYADLMTMLREQLWRDAQCIIGRAARIETGDERQTVFLSDGRAIEARLLVLATGHAETLRRSLGVVKRQVDASQTICAGFSLQAPAGGFPFPALAAYGERAGDGVDYVSIFPLGEKMRANFFMFGEIDDERVLRLRKQPVEGLIDFLPGLRRWIAQTGAASDTQLFPVAISICDNVRQPGVVLIGDAYRTSCPAVGTGLSCALTDVMRLKDHALAWLKTPGMGAEKIAAFYDDPVKQARDRSTHELALERRRTVLDQSLQRRARRAVYFARRNLAWRLGRSPGK